LHCIADGSIGVVAADEVTGAELLAVTQPLAFLEGAMGSPPSVEDLHIAMLEAELGPAVTKILSYLPRKPSPAAAVRADAASPSSSGSSSDPQQQQHQQQADSNAQELPPSMTHLQPAFWAQVQQGAGGLVAKKLGSKQLMRLLQASCWSEEFQDPAVAQVNRWCLCLAVGITDNCDSITDNCDGNTDKYDGFDCYKLSADVCTSNPPNA
jgi:hypothetical protein